MNGPRIGWQIGLTAGAIAGAIAAIAAEATAALAGRSFPEVTPVAIAVASILPNLAGGLLYWQLARRTTQPGVIYAAIAVVVSLIYTFVVGFNSPPHPHFMSLIIPLHAVVTMVTVVMLPSAAGWLARRKWRSQS